MSVHHYELFPVIQGQGGFFRNLMHILIIDNDDSYTLNLVPLLLRNPSVTVQVVRRRLLASMQDAEPLLSSADGILISPGPGRPDNGKVIRITR